MTTMGARLLVVVSGLPASGKTTVGRVLSEGLSLPLIDKDAILEALFDSLGCDDSDQRRRLSRASEEVLLTQAGSSGAAVLVSWWHHDTAPARLTEIAQSLVEVFCDCPLDVAAARFAARERHPGHLDQLPSRRTGRRDCVSRTRADWDWAAPWSPSTPLPRSTTTRWSTRCEPRSAPRMCTRSSQPPSSGRPPLPTETPHAWSGSCRGLRLDDPPGRHLHQGRVHQPEYQWSDGVARAAPGGDAGRRGRRHGGPAGRGH